jgi:hypothetical protein
MRIRELKKAYSISLVGLALTPVVVGLIAVATPFALLDYCRKNKKDKTTYNKGEK